MGKNNQLNLLKYISSESKLYDFCEQNPEIIINLDLNKLENFINNNL